MAALEGPSSFTAPHHQQAASAPTPCCTQLSRDTVASAVEVEGTGSMLEMICTLYPDLLALA